MPRYNDAPVSPEKIKLINEMLNDPVVGQLWKEYTMLGQPEQQSANSLIKKRVDTFHAYAVARDAYLGLPPLTIKPIQGTHQRYRM